MSVSPDFEAVAVAIVLIGIMSLIPVVDIVLRWVGKGNRREISPNPLTVRADERFVQHETHCEEMKKNRDEHSNIFGRMCTVEGDVSALKAIVNVNGARLSQMDMKLDRILERMTVRSADQ